MIHTSPVKATQTSLYDDHSSMLRDNEVYFVGFKVGFIWDALYLICQSEKYFLTW